MMKKSDTPKDQKEIMIGNQPIGLDHPPFIIAEMSGNHNQELDRALQIVDAAAECRVQAIKLQTYTADSMTIKSDQESFCINDRSSLWYGKTLYELYEQAHTPRDWLEPIFRRCRQRGLTVFSSVFDDADVKILEALDVPAYKIASFENIHLPLIQRVASTGKPLIISTGMASISELEEAIQTAHQSGCEQIILLKCTSAYPASPRNSNLLTIPHLRKLFGYEVGLSDHTLGIGVAVASVALGATIIEKHFTLDRSSGGVDSAFSLEPSEMQMLVTETHKAWQSLGEIHYGPTDNELNSLIFRRSIYIVEDLKAGEKFTPNNIRIIRPGDGLAPKHYHKLLGHTATRDLKKGTPMEWVFVH